jgi:hypothetical protein
MDAAFDGWGEGSSEATLLIFAISSLLPLPSASTEPLTLPSPSRGEGKAMSRCARSSNSYFFGFSNFKTKLSASPIAKYFALSCSPKRNVGGNVHTPPA